MILLLSNDAMKPVTDPYHHSQKVVHVQEFPMCTRFLSLYSICKLLGNFLLLLETPRKWTKFHKFGNCFAH